MQDMMKGLRQQYMAAIRAIDLENLLSILPSSAYANYYPLMRGILGELANEISEWHQAAHTCTDPDEKREYEKETEIATQKLRICEEHYRQTYAIEDEPKTMEESTTPRFHLVYGTNPAGNIPFKSDLERDVDIHYYEQISSMLEDLELGNNTGNEIKRKRLGSSIKSLRGMCEIKEFQIRIMYRELPNNILYIEMVRVKKDDWSLKDKSEIEARDALLAKDYNLLKQRIKSGEKVEELIIQNQNMTAELRRYIEENKIGRKK